MLSECGDPSMVVNDALSDLDEETRNILEQSAAYETVSKYLAEAYLAGEKVSILTAIAATTSWPMIRAIARDRAPLNMLDHNHVVVMALSDGTTG